MGEGEREVVEVVAEVAGEGAAAFGGDAAGAEEGVAQERMAGRGQVDPDLVRAAGRDLDLDQGGAGAALEDPDPAVGPLPFRVRGMDRAEERMGDGADRNVDIEQVFMGHARDQGAVELLRASAPP